MKPRRGDGRAGLKLLISYDVLTAVDLILRLQAQRIRFVMRVPTRFYREIAEAPARDDLVTIRITPDRHATCTAMPLSCRSARSSRCGSSGGRYPPGREKS